MRNNTYVALNCLPAFDMTYYVTETTFHNQLILFDYKYSRDYFDTNSLTIFYMGKLHRLSFDFCTGEYQWNIHYISCSMFISQL